MSRQPAHRSEYVERLSREIDARSSELEAEDREYEWLRLYGNRRPFRVIPASPRHLIILRRPRA